MDEDLKFGHNWNNKLNCDCFTTLRLHNPKRYFVGAVKNIKLNEVFKGKATILCVVRFRLDQISEHVARLDTGYSAEDCKKMIRTMYKDKPINWNTQLLDFPVLMYLKPEQQKLF